ncbi:hypothetical protein HMPREF0201_04649 [Cedecea davisae DSM 4568]|uniref:Uncharacterized protein n=1 Tax=Cedecea davisae DSM 4568 TaxID=566551 RepID=S3IKW7_9ENTR|nr:hypothetical protein HMPREF0201_04649 [Cedecea davisae DSM 4568]
MYFTREGYIVCSISCFYFISRMKASLEYIKYLFNSFTINRGFCSCVKRQY